MAAGKSFRFPYNQKPYDYDGAELQKAWNRLHKGDREPYPDATAVQQAGRAFHRGDFADALAQGARRSALGSIASS